MMIQIEISPFDTDDLVFTRIEQKGLQDFHLSYSFKLHSQKQPTQIPSYVLCSFKNSRLCWTCPQKVIENSTLYCFPFIIL
jgi:hypothetical protein